MNIYVDTGVDDEGNARGNDANPGTQDAPLATYAEAVQRAECGEPIEVVVASGTMMASTAVRILQQLIDEKGDAPLLIADWNEGYKAPTNATVIERENDAFIVDAR